MRICVIGKYPPIQGGVSMRTYRTAHALAARGHEVHVVTNAKEVAPPFRMHMRPQDWQGCELHSGQGSATVHWTDLPDRSQFHIPMSSPFVSKLASIAAGVHAAHPFDVIFSHYLEPYGVAGHLAAQMTGAPHVVRMAGSDAGRLWRHPQLEGLYDHVLRSAKFVVAVGPVAERAAARGIDPARIVPGGGYALPEDEFAPDGPKLDLKALRDEVAGDDALRDMLWGGFAGNAPHIGVYGKLGDNKGSFALLDALHQLKQRHLDLGLVALAHGRPEIEQRFRGHVSKLGLIDRILQIPFLPHWRVPEFLRGCLAVCCLEQDFPIHFHNPIVLLEVLLSGTCLVASTETIRKLPRWDRLPSGYGCVAIKDVNDVQELSGKLAAIVRQSQFTGAVGARGREFARECQDGVRFPEALERILEAAAENRPLRSIASEPDPSGTGEPEWFPLTQIARVALQKRTAKSRGAPNAESPSARLDLPEVRKVREKLRNANLHALVQAVDVEIAMAEAEIGLDQATQSPAADPLFRLNMAEWAFDSRALGNSMPIRDPRLRVLRFEHDISGLLSIRSVADFPASLATGPSYLVVFSRTALREPALVDAVTARILELSDGTRSGNQIIEEVGREFGDDGSTDRFVWLEQLLVSGFIGLHAEGPG